MSRWRSTATDEGAEIVPLGDLVEHDDTDECVCGPTSEPVKRDDGSMGWLVVHHAPRRPRLAALHPLRSSSPG